jgi:tryptophan halogenase
MMSRNRAFLRGQDGRPIIPNDFGYHLENERFVALLEQYIRRAAIPITDDTIQDVRVDERGVKELVLASGGTASADLYLDCSGFRSILLGKAMAEPFVSYKPTLWCDRAVVGGWDRGADEPIQPYTIAETMDAGWCWRIDHTNRVNRGYVFSSGFLSDEQAEAELRRKNPKVQRTRIVPFVSGRYERAWVKNVVGIGNAAGFVEPLEATALGVICASAENLGQLLYRCGATIKPTVVDLFNQFNTRQWEQIRRFLSVHYKFNTRLDTPFWRECRQKVDLAGTEPLIEFFRENGPTGIWRNVLNDPNDAFGVEGYLSMFVGQQVPYDRDDPPTQKERATWEDIRRWIVSQAQGAMTVPEAQRAIQSPTAPQPSARAGVFSSQVVPNIGGR